MNTITQGHTPTAPDSRKQFHIMPELSNVLQNILLPYINNNYMNTFIIHKGLYTSHPCSPAPAVFVLIVSE